MKNKNNKSLFNLPKLFPVIIFFLLVFNIPTNKAQAICWTDTDCEVCNGCVFGFCVKASTDTRCDSYGFCEYGSCKKDCLGECKASCSGLNESPGDPFEDGWCEDTTLNCCVQRNTEGGDNCTCMPEINCAPENIGSPIDCAAGNVCCYESTSEEEPEDPTIEAPIITIPDTGTIIYTSEGEGEEDNNISNLESGSNAKTNVLFQGIDCINSGDCKIEDLMTVGINITKFLLGIIGSVALFFFVFAGFKMLTSRGNEQAITSAKQMMVQTVIGIFIFFSAFLIVSSIRTTLLTEEYNTPLGDAYKGEEVKPVDEPVDESVDESVATGCNTDLPNEKYFVCMSEPSNYNYFLGKNTCAKHHSCKNGQVCCKGCETSHPNWTCKACGTESQCNKKVDKGTCAKGYCPGNKTNLCCK